MIQICLLSFISGFGIRISNFFNEEGLLDLMSMSRARVRHIFSAKGAAFTSSPSRSVKSSFTSSLARRIASLGSITTCSRACTLMWRQSAMTLVLNLCASAVLLITFSRHDAAANTFPSRVDRTDQENIVEVDQNN